MTVLHKMGLPQFSRVLNLHQYFRCDLVGLSFFILCFASFSFCLETDRPYGEASFKFLKLPLSPRIVALAGAGAALADGAGEIDLNPAAAATPFGNDTGRLVLGRGYPFSEFQTTSSNITWDLPLRAYRILINARYLGFQNIPGYSDLATPTTAYGAHTIKGQAGVAGMLRDVSYGITLNFAGNSIANANYATAMINSGLRYSPLSGLYFGASLLNADFWNSGSKDPNNRDPFPPTAVQAGVSYSHAIGSQWSAALVADARARNDEDLVYPMGIEVAWQSMITARLGFPVGEMEPGVSAGLGLKWTRYKFEYAFQSHESLGPGHFWALELAY